MKERAGQLRRRTYSLSYAKCEYCRRYSRNVRVSCEVRERCLKKAARLEVVAKQNEASERENGGRGKERSTRMTWLYLVDQEGSGAEGATSSVWRIQLRESRKRTRQMRRVAITVLFLLIYNLQSGAEELKLSTLSYNWATRSWEGASSG